MAKGKKPKTWKPTHKTVGPRLSAQDVRFAQLLFNRGAKSQVACYLEAGFPDRGNANANGVAAHRKVRSRNFREYYRQLQEDAAADARVTAAGIVRGYHDGCEWDPADITNADDTLKPLTKWPRHIRTKVKKYKVRRKPVFQLAPGPADAEQKVKVKVGEEVEVEYVFEDRTACRNALANIRGLTNAGPLPADGHKPLVVRGADPDKL